MSDFLEAWANESPENAKLSAQESLILEVTEEIWRLLDEKDISKAQLAEAMQKSKAYVTQLLNGSRNMTLRTLSDISIALGVKPAFGFHGIVHYSDEDVEWSTDENVRLFNPSASFSKKTYKVSGNVIYPGQCWNKAA